MLPQIKPQRIIFSTVAAISTLTLCNDDDYNGWKLNGLQFVCNYGNK